VVVFSPVLLIGSQLVILTF